jgi:hypothetical protein
MPSLLGFGRDCYQVRGKAGIAQCAIRSHFVSRMAPAFWTLFRPAGRKNANNFDRWKSDREVYRSNLVNWTFHKPKRLRRLVAFWLQESQAEQVPQVFVSRAVLGEAAALSDVLQCEIAA